MTRPARSLIGAVLLLAGATAARAEEPAREPFELVRSLHVLQDRIVRGSAEAHGAQRQVMADISVDLAAIEPRHWQEPRNVRAAVLYVLSGGDPRVLRKLLGLGRLPGETDRLVRGALAYAEGRSSDAAEHLSSIEARMLDPDIAGAVALVQSVVVANADPAQALLDEARLLSPGTLVEESALRRQILLLPAAGRLDRLESLLSRYLRRFGRSYYASAFWGLLEGLLAGFESADARDRLAHFEDLIAMLPGDSRQQLYLAVAQEGIARGRVGLARSAAAMVTQLANAGSSEQMRAQLYEAAALIVTEEYGRGLSSLSAIAGDKLPASDAGLHDAALRLARQIRRNPDPDASLADRQPTEEAVGRARELSAIGLAVIARAKTVLASADAVLSGGTQ